MRHGLFSLPMKISLLAILAAVVVALVWSSTTAAPPPPPRAVSSSVAVPAYPGAQGSGAQTRGGRGGKVMIVSSLADSGPGTLRDCIEQSGPRTCVFAVSGTIELARTLYVTEPFLTVAGQSAPAGGIQITNAIDASERDLASLVLISTHEVIWTHTRLRNRFRDICSDNATSECGQLFGIESSAHRKTYNVIASYNSLTWNQDEGFGVWAGADSPIHNVTLSMNLIAEGLESHSTGMIAGGSDPKRAGNVYDIDFHHNLVMSNSHRNPLMKNRSGRVVNNIFYSQGFYSSQFGGGGEFDVIGNVYRPGPLSKASPMHEVLGFISASAEAPLAAPKLYLAGNIGWNQPDPLGDQWLLTGLVTGENGVEIGKAPQAWRRRTPLAAPQFPITVDPLAQLAGGKGIVASQAGASRRVDCDGKWVADRDAVDLRLISEYASNSGAKSLPLGQEATTRLPTPAAGPACVDTDGDGLPDVWERAWFGDLAQRPGDDADRGGFTNLEAWLWGIPPSRVSKPR